MTARVSLSRSLKKYARFMPNLTPLTETGDGAERPMITASSSATSATVCAIGPTVSREWAIGVTPSWL